MKALIYNLSMQYILFTMSNYAALTLGAEVGAGVCYGVCYGEELDHGSRLEAMEQALEAMGQALETMGQAMDQAMGQAMDQAMVPYTTSGGHNVD